MAGVLAGTLRRISSLQSSTGGFLYSRSALSSSQPSQLPLLYRLVGQRDRSNFSGKSQLLEVDLDSDGGSVGEVEVMTLRKLEDVIDSIIVRRAAPDWIPFIPGSSYWVPPHRRPSGLIEVIEKFTNPLTEEETMSLTTDRGWPSSAFFIEGTAPSCQAPVELQVELEVEVKVKDNLDNRSQSDDEEG